MSSGRVICEKMNAVNRRIRPVIISRTGKWIISPQVIEADESRDWLDAFFYQASAEWESPAVSLAEALQHMMAERVSCAFLAFHGEYGEDGGIQGLLQTAGIPFTGSGILGSAVALNKFVSIAAFARAGLRVARSVKATRRVPHPVGLDTLTLPVFAKPVQGGSSLGVSLVKEQSELQDAIMRALEVDVEALIEEKISGVEVSCSVLDLLRDDVLQTVALPPTLIEPLEAEFFDYDAKYVAGKSRDTTPAPLPEDVVESIRNAALTAHYALGCEGMSRSDMIVEPVPGSIPVMLETQTIPGMTPTSLLPQQAEVYGISFAQLLDGLISHALWRAKEKGTVHGTVCP